MVVDVLGAGQKEKRSRELKLAGFGT